MSADLPPIPNNRRLGWMFALMLLFIVVLMGVGTVWVYSVGLAREAARMTPTAIESCAPVFAPIQDVNNPNTTPSANRLSLSLDVNAIQNAIITTPDAPLTGNCAPLP